jgi:hypothetical protein
MPAEGVKDLILVWQGGLTSSDDPDWEQKIREAVWLAPIPTTGPVVLWSYNLHVGLAARERSRSTSPIHALR